MSQHILFIYIIDVHNIYLHKLFKSKKSKLNLLFHLSTKKKKLKEFITFEISTVVEVLVTPRGTLKKKQRCSLEAAKKKY